MSADNGHIIRNTSDGKFALQMYFDSDEEYPDVEETRKQDRYDTLEEAIKAYNKMCHNFSYVDEYGLTIAVKPTQKEEHVLTPDEIENRFGFHRATLEGPEATQPKHVNLREEFKKFAEHLNNVLPDGRNKSFAITELECASMWSHKAIAETAPLVEE